VSKLRIIVYMKRLLVIVVLLVLVVLVCIEVFIPSTVKVSPVVPVRSRAAAIFRVLRNEDRWMGWWPNSSMGLDNGELWYHGLGYRVEKLSYNIVDVGIRTSSEELESRISIIPVGSQDSSLLQWSCDIPVGSNPLRKIGRYAEARKIASAMKELLGFAADYLGKKENIYGVSVGESSTRDTLLVAEEGHFRGYPGNADIYGLVNAVKKRIADAGGKVTGYPMVNISGGDTGYKVRVAVPTDRNIPAVGRFYFMRLIPGNYLVTAVTGGQGAVNNALEGMKEYISDYQRTVMAIPFQSLVTDREEEKDSTKWKTRIYYPIF
jgi:hypothetical protein